MKGHIQTQSYVLFLISEMDLSLNMSCLRIELSQPAYEKNHITNTYSGNDMEVKGADLGCRDSRAQLGGFCKFLMCLKVNHCGTGPPTYLHM